MTRVFLIIFLALVAAAGLSFERSPRTAEAADSIAWAPCGQIECATFSVPLDYSNPGGETISLSLIRIKAREQSERIGVLMANPGGPGGSANDFVRIWRSILAGDIRDRFDIVSFDPRGVGESSPVVCHDRLQALVAVDPDPDTDAEWQLAKDVSQAFAVECREKYANVLPHLGTKNVARDMDRIREALGEPKLNYVGYSYGTSIGGVYADMFPDRIRAMVLDGGTDLSLDYEQTSLTQMIGFERAFEAYLADCKAKSCALAKNGEPRAAVDAIIARAEAEPLQSRNADRPAGPGEVQLGIISAMYSKTSWNALTRALQDAQNGDGSGLVRLSDSYLQREGDGGYPNLIEANIAINSVDTECSKDPESYRALGEEFAKQAPLFGRSAATSGLVCAYWAAKADPVEAPEGKGAPPIVVISTTNDPATPYEWGRALSEQLESGVLVTHRGEGHTIYAQGNACIDKVVNAYLLNGDVPAEGTTCGNGPPPPDSSGGVAAEPPPSVEDDDTTPRAPGPPSTGASDRRDGSAQVGLWAFGLAAVALGAAVVAVAAARRN